MMENENVDNEKNDDEKTDDKKIDEEANDKRTNDKGTNDKGTNDKGTNDKGTNDKEINDKEINDKEMGTEGIDKKEIDEQEIKGKLARLKGELLKFKNVAVAFSGGVDSTLLLFAAKKILKDKAVAFTIDAEFVPDDEIERSKKFCEKYGIEQHIVHVKMEDIPGFRKNPKDRCYLCKKNMFSKLLDMAYGMDIHYLAEGSNLDDGSDYRPGLKAIKELGVKSPLCDAKLTKKDIRNISCYLNLDTYDMPSNACYATRFAYGDLITSEKILAVKEAENILKEHGFVNVRVRAHGNLARIEIMPDQFELVLKTDIREKMIACLKSCGFVYVSLDLEGYRVGSMNEGV